MLGLGHALVISLPPPPLLPSSFSVNLSISSLQGSLLPHLHFGPSGSASFLFENSSVDGTLRQRLDQQTGFAASLWTLYTPSNRSLRVYGKFADDCRPIPHHFAILAFDLSWLPWSTFVGTVRVGASQTANRFFYSDGRSFNNYTAVVSQAGVLLYVDSTFFGKLPGTGDVSLSQRHTFTSRLVERRLPPSLFQIPALGCYEKVPPCREGAATVMEVYLAHPHQFAYLDNQDSADAKGDVAFLCPDLLKPETAAFNQYDQVSLWKVEVDTHWGQYELCNGYPAVCYGLEDFYMGRQVPYGSRRVPLSGQCTSNLGTGSWYSHTLGGKCSDNQRPGTGECTWRPIERTKTIDLKCLAHGAGMVETCKTDIAAAGGFIPGASEWIFNTSLKVFVDAFSTDDPTKGGCPNVRTMPQESP